MTRARDVPRLMRRRAFLAAGLAAALPLSVRSAAREPVRIRVSATPSIFKATFQQLCDRFEARQTGIAVDLVTTARNQDEQVQKTLRQSLIGDLPDVSFEGLNFLRRLHSRRIAVPLNELIANDAEWNDADYGRSQLEAASVGKTLVGLAVAISVPVLYYNATRTTPVFGSPALPRDWAGILDVVARLNDTAGSRFMGGYCRHAPGNWMYTALVQSHGGALMSADECRSAFGAPAARRALDIYQSFGRAGQARSRLSGEQARQAFVAGGIGILVDSSSSLVNFQRHIAGQFALGTAAMPVVPQGRIPPSGIAVLMFARDRARQAAAWQFMKFVAGVEGQKIIAESTGYFPANDVPLRPDGVLGQRYREQPLLAPIVETLPLTARWDAFPGDNSAKIDDVIYDEVAAVIALSKAPEQAIAAMTRRVEMLLPSAVS